MALSRKTLKGMGLTDEQIEGVIEGHTETVDGLNARIKALEADAQKAQALQQELDGLKNGGDDWKAKHDQVQGEFEAYKQEVAGKERAANVRAAYRKMLEGINIDPRRIDAILKATDFKDIQLGENNQLENAEKLAEDAKKEWGDFVMTEQKRGANVQTPPEGGAKQMTREEILGIKDAGERQRAIAENHEMFGF